MESDAIGMRSRANITGPKATPSTSPGPSRRSSLVREASPTPAPDSTTQLSYEFEDSDAIPTISAPTASELIGALGALNGARPRDALPSSSVDGIDFDPAPSPFEPYELAHMFNPEGIGALGGFGGIDLLRGLGTDGLVANTQHIHSSESSHKPNSGSAYNLPNTEAGKNPDDGKEAKYLGLSPCPGDNLDSSDGEPCEPTFSVSQEFSFSSSSERDDDP